MGKDDGFFIGAGQILNQPLFLFIIYYGRSFAGPLSEEESPDGNPPHQRKNIEILD
jgi:hypothetical protein